MKKSNLNLPATKRDLKKLATKKELKNLVGGLDKKIGGGGEKLRIEIRHIWKKMGEEIKEEIEQSGNRIINRLKSHLPKKE